jgi:hypothetical protein
VPSSAVTQSAKASRCWSSGTAALLNVKAGGVEIISTGGFESGSNISSGGTFEAIGNANVAPNLLSGAILEVGSGAVASVTNEVGVTVKVLSGGMVGGGTALFHNVVTALNGGVVSNLTVSSGGKVTVFSGGTDLGVAILKGGIVIVSSGGLDTGAAIGSGGTELVSVGGTAVAAATIGSGALLETANGGTAIVSGTVLNSGTFIASGPGSLVEIVSGAAVTGGAVIVGNGILDVLSGGSADVAFLATGSGGLVIADTQNATSAFAGKVSGFGGASHSNHKQFIDLTSVTFVSGQIDLSYTSAASHTSWNTVRLQRRRGGGRDQHDRRPYVGELQRQSRQQRQCGDRRPDGAQWRQHRKLPVARHRGAEYRVRRAHDARLF